jgi:hypothetical protein
LTCDAASTYYQYFHTSSRNAVEAAASDFPVMTKQCKGYN